MPLPKCNFTRDPSPLCGCGEGEHWSRLAVGGTNGGSFSTTVGRSHTSDGESTKPSTVVLNDRLDPERCVGPHHSRIRKFR
jgi:hypothetical protein